MTERARTVFLGSGSFAVPIVETLAQHPSVDLVAVVTAPTRIGSRGRPSDAPVAEWAAARAIPMLRPVRLRAPESVAELAALAPDLLVLADYGQIVPQDVLDLPTHGALNVHPSRLPRYRGAAPIPAAILAGDAETGVTLMLMDAGLDSGPIVAQSHRTLTGDEIAPQLEEELARDGAELLATNLAEWLAGDIWPRPQDEAGITLTRPLRRSDGLLEPSRTAAELERQVRAYQPWPGSFVETNAGRLIVWQSHVEDESTAPLTLVTVEGSLVIDEAQLAGGRRMSAADLARGRPDIRIGAPQTA